MDINKFKSSLQKSMPNIGIGLTDPLYWIDTGSFMLNKLLSDDFHKGIPYGKVSMFAGESGSGKSYIVSGNLVKHALDDGATVVLVDTENALDLSWLAALGVDASNPNLFKVTISMIDDLAKLLTTFMEQYKVSNEGKAPEKMEKVLFVIDSLGMLLTPTDVNQFEAGELKGDLGRKAKSLLALVRNIINVISPYPIAVCCTNHTYASQNMYDPDDKVSGGTGFVFAASQVVLMNKFKLKEDDNGNKTPDVVGIRARCKVIKTRYAKPFEHVELTIPYTTGMNPYSGLFEFFVSCGLYKRSGNSYEYINKVTGETTKRFRKDWTNDLYDLTMQQFESSDFDTGMTSPVTDDGEKDKK